MDDDTVTEDQCLICRRWPAAERADRRPGYFRVPKGGLLLIPVHEICPACELAHFEAINATRH
jgi:hypothetical protein